MKQVNGMPPSFQEYQMKQARRLQMNNNRWANPSFPVPTGGSIPQLLRKSPDSPESGTSESSGWVTCEDQAL
jgi:hypothetical protein